MRGKVQRTLARRILIQHPGNLCRKLDCCYALAEASGRTRERRLEPILEVASLYQSLALLDQLTHKIEPTSCGTSRAFMCPGSIVDLAFFVGINSEAFKECPEIRWISIGSLRREVAAIDTGTTIRIAIWDGAVCGGCSFAVIAKNWSPRRSSSISRRYALAAFSLPSGRKYCVPLIGAETFFSSSCRSSLRSTKSISLVFTISRSDCV